MNLAALTGWAAAGSLLAATLSLWRARRRRMEAIARACHEVRGPLTAVGLGLSLSARTGELSPEHVRALETELRRAALALADLGERVRRRPGFDRGERERVSLAALLAEAVLAARGRAAAAGVQLGGVWEGPDAIVYGSRLRLAQALGNLITNAVEHGEGAVFVRGDVRGARARIEVADAGPGLPATVAELARRPRGGRGARGRGLAITSEIARCHGGAISTAPAARGAIVMLTLPAGAAVRSRRA